MSVNETRPAVKQRQARIASESGEETAIPGCPLSGTGRKVPKLSGTWFCCCFRSGLRSKWVSLFRVRVVSMARLNSRIKLWISIIALASFGASLHVMPTTITSKMKTCLRLLDVLMQRGPNSTPEIYPH